MLVIKRKQGAGLVLDFTRASDEEVAALRSGRAVIGVTPQRFNGHRAVHLGVEAPRGVRIFRGEVYDAERAAAVTTAAAAAAAQKEGGASGQAA